MSSHANTIPRIRIDSLAQAIFKSLLGSAKGNAVKILDLALRLGDFGFSAEEVELVLLTLTTKGSDHFTLEEFGSALTAISVNTISNQKTTRLADEQQYNSVQKKSVVFSKDRWLRLVLSPTRGEESESKSPPLGLFNGQLDQILSQPKEDRLILFCDEMFKLEASIIVKEVFPFAATLYRINQRYCHPTVIHATEAWQDDIATLNVENSSTIAIVCLGVSPSKYMEALVRHQILDERTRKLDSARVVWVVQQQSDLAKTDLHALIQPILRHDNVFRTRYVREETTGPMVLQDGIQVMASMCDAIVDSLHRLVSALPSIQLDPLALEISWHLQLVSEMKREQLFGGQAQAMEEVDTFLQTRADGAPFVITTDAGCGVTTMMATAAAKVSVNLRSQGSVIVRFIEKSQASISLGSLLRGICLQCAAIDGQHHPNIGYDERALMAAFPTWLKAATKGNRRLVVMLEGVESIRSDQKLACMEWLPQIIPTRVHVVLSVKKGTDAHYALVRRRSNSSHSTWLSSPHVGGFNAPETPIVVRNILERQDWQSQPELDAAVHSATASFLATRTLATVGITACYARGSNDPSFITSLAPSTDISQLVSAALLSVAQTHGRELTFCVAALLVGSKEGLLRAELEDLLSLDPLVINEIAGDSPSSSFRIPSPTVSNIFSALNRVGLTLGSRKADGWLLMRFASSSIASAVLETLLSTAVAKERIFGLLAKYFISRSVSKREEERIESDLGGVAPQPVSLIGDLWLPGAIVNIRRLTEQFSCLEGCGSWENVVQNTCNMEFVESRCAAGQIGVSLGEFSNAIKLVPKDRPDLRRRLAHFRQFITLHLNTLYDTPQSCSQLARDMPIEDDVSVSVESVIKSTAHTKNLQSRKHYLALGRSRFPSQLFLETPQPEKCTCVTFCNTTQHGLLIAVGTGRSIALWDALTGSHVITITLPSSSGSVTALAADPADQNFLASTGDAFRLWDLSNFTSLLASQPMVTAELRCSCVAFSRDGSIVAAAGDGDVKLWNTSKSQSPWSLAATVMLIGHGSLHSISFSHDNSHFATGSAGGVVFVCAVATMAVTHKFQCHDSNVWGLAFASNGDLITCGHDGKVARWEPIKGTLIASVDDVTPQGGAVLSLALSSDESKLAIGCEGGEIRLLSPSTFAILQRDLIAFPSIVRGLAFCTSGAQFLCACSTEAPATRVWMLEEVQHEESQSHTGSVNALVHCHQTVFSGGEDGRVLAWAQSTGEFLMSFGESSSEVDHLHHQQPPSVTALAAAMVGAAATVIVGRVDGTVSRHVGLEDKKGNLVAQVSGSVSALVISDDGSAAVVWAWAHNGEGMLQCSFKSGENSSAVIGHGRTITEMALTGAKDGDFKLATASLDSSIKIWAMFPGKVLNHLRTVALPSIPNCISWNVKIANNLVAGCQDGTVVAVDSLAGTFDSSTRSAGLWWDKSNIIQGRGKGQPQHQCTSLAFSPNGSRVAVGLNNNSVKILEMSSHATMMHLRPPYPGENQMKCTSIVWISDDTIIVSSTDGLVRVWDVTEELNDLRVARNEEEARDVLCSDGMPDVNSVDSCGWGILHYATVNGLVGVMRAVTAETWGADLDLKTRSGVTALQLSLLSRQPQIAEILLKVGARVDSSVAVLAAKRGYDSVLELMLDSGSLTVELLNSGIETSLEAACSLGHFRAAKVLLSAKASPTLRPGLPYSPLILAARSGSAECIAALLEAGVSVHEEGAYPLHDTVSSRSEAAVTVLLKARADTSLRTKDWKSETALHRAASVGCERVVAVLIQSKVDISTSSGLGSALQVALDAGNATVANLLLDAGASCLSPPENATSVLTIASRRGFEQLVRRMMAMGVDVNDFGGSEWTPLHEAASAEVAVALIDGGANVEARSRQGGMTPLLSAALARRSGVIQVLISAKADALAVDSQGDSVLHCLFSGKAPWNSASDLHQTLQLLQSSGASVNFQNKIGRCPLHLASTPDGVKALLECRADTAIRDSKKKTVLHTASSGRAGIELLVGAGGKINADDSEKQTPLIRFLTTYASINSPTYVNEHVAALLHASANPNALAADGTTALIACRQLRLSSVETLLLAHGAEDPVISFQSPGAGASKSQYTTGRRGFKSHAVATTIALKAFAKMSTLSRLVHALPTH